MKTLKLLVLGAALISGLTACLRQDIIFSSDPRIIRGNWAGSAKRICANVSQTAWSPDGTKIAANGNRTVIWDAVTGARVRVIAEGSQQVVWTATSIITVSPLRYVPDLNASAMGVKFWNPVTGVLERSLNINGNSLVVSPDGTRGAVVNSTNYDAASASIISLTDGTKQRDLDVTPFGSGMAFRIRSVLWTPDGSRVIAVGESQKLNDYSASPVNLLRVWQASTGSIERSILSALITSISPDGKTLVYSTTGGYDQPSSGLNFMNLETGAVRDLPSSNQFLGWNPSGSKFYLQSSDGAATEVWNLTTLKLEKSVPGFLRPWNGVGAPVDTAVIPYSGPPYGPTAECNLKILDLNSLKTTRTLDETTLDPLELKLSLNATYFSENQYGISGTATVGTTSFKVRGLENVGSNQRLLPQTSPPIEVPTFLELLDANGATVWTVAHFGNLFVSIQAGPIPLNAYEYSNEYGYGSNNGPDRYNLTLTRTP